MLSKRIVFQLSRSLRRSVSSAKENEEKEEPVWKDPFKYALRKSETRTEFEETEVDWHCVEGLMPLKLIPEVPKHKCYPTPSGWFPPKESNHLSYFVSRRRDHLFPLFLKVRRDVLDPKTMDFTYVEIVELRRVSGDVFACASDLRTFLEGELNHPVATNVDEIKGMISVKGAERKLLEKFLFNCGF